MLSKQNIQNIYTLSPMQEGMYFHWLYEKSSAYFEQVSCHINGNLNIAYVKSSFEELLKRYDILRTVFTNKSDKKIIQIVLKERDIDFYYEDITQKENKDIYIIEFRERDRKRSFDLSKDILIRISVLKINENEYEFIWSFHHILIDGWCVGILLSEFFEIYNSYIEGRTYVLPKVKQYREYIKWLEKQDKELSRRYWNNYLNDYEEAAVVPCSNLNKGNAESDNHYNYKQGIVILEINRPKSSNFRELAIRNNVTLNTVFQVIWGILLGRYNNKNDVVFGSVVSGRPSEIDGVEAMVGLFINTVPIRIEYEENIRFNELLNIVQENAIESESYHYYPLVEMQSESQLKQNLIDHIVVFENYPIDLKFDGVFSSKSKNKRDKEITFKLDDIEVFDQSNYDFNVIIAPGELLEVKFSYNQNKYSTELVESISNHFLQLFNQVLLDDTLYIHELTILSPKEREQLLNEFNDTKVDYPRDKTVQELFERQVLRAPNTIALVSEDAELTYGLMNKRSNQLGLLLRDRGINPDSMVGIMEDRSIEMMVGILGILKAGGAYLPIDSEFPEERIRYMLRDSSTELLLTERKYLGRLSEPFTTILLDDYDVYKGKSNKNPENINTSRDLAYIMYTSGSMGTPKSVMVEHMSINRLVIHSNYVKFSEKTRILQTGAPVFDATTFEIWGALLNGGQLFLISKENILDANKLAISLVKNDINTLWLSAPLFNQLLDENKEMFYTLTYLVVGGDILSPWHINIVKGTNRELKVVNGYGPTENTTFSVCHLIESEYQEQVPIGRPISNSTAYIYDKGSNLVPIGVIGELYVGGDGVSRGYLNNSERTSERFIENPYVSGDRLYCTGDLARWLPDGIIEFLGRIDNQVKIRGFRIELGEIESKLLKHERIRDAIVLSKVDEKRNKYLCAYIVSKESKRQEGSDSKSKRGESTSTIDMTELRDCLSGSLPEYMVPSYFVEIEKIPLTANGKIDRRSLPEPDRVSGEEYAAPRNKTEMELVEIWSEVLNVEREMIGIDSDFFELGGHSLKATILISKIHKKLNIEVPLVEVFESPTIRELSNCIKSRSKRDNFVSINSVEKKEYYPLSPAQKRLYILQQMEVRNTSYNLPGVIELAKDGKLEELEKAFFRIISRHESLRTSFDIVNSEPVQTINREVNFKIENYHLKSGVIDKNRGVGSVMEKFVRPFDLKKAPLFRVGVINGEFSNWILLLDLHHIITDGTSQSVLEREFYSLYSGAGVGAGGKLPLSRLQYKDFAEWQTSKEQQEWVKDQEKYWLKELSDELPVLNLPTDFLRPLVQSFEGASVSFVLNQEEAKGIKDLARNIDGTLFMVMLSIFNIFLSKLSGNDHGRDQEDIIVGTPIAGRRHADLENIIGMFVNTLALRNSPRGDKSLKEFLNEVKQRTLEAYENQEYQFEDLVDRVFVKRDAGRNPIFDVMLNVLNQDEYQYRDDHSFDIERGYRHINDQSKFDMTLSVVDYGNHIGLSLNYCTKLFNAGTIDRFIRYFRGIVEQVTKGADRKISEIELITGAEKDQILYDFNNSNTETECPGDKTIHQLFEEQVEKFPDQIALVYKAYELSYMELNQRVNRLARVLRKKGVKSDNIVGIMVDRSPEMIIGILGILKAGGAYLPINPEDPDKRIKNILEDSNTGLLLTRYSYMDRFENLFETIDLEDSNLYKGSCENLVQRGSSKNLAYVIYTSGSTGNPKGVVIDHSSVNNLVFSLNEKVYKKYTGYLRVAVAAPYIFDASIKQVFGALLLGHSLFIIPENIRIDGELFIHFLKTNKIEISDATPSHLQLLLAAINGGDLYLNVKNLLVGGEPLSKQILTDFFDAFKREGLSITNVYGPAECCVDATSYGICREEVKNLNQIPIGKSLPNVNVYVLDNGNKLVPIGIPGELCISGVGVSRGYLNRPTFTEDMFINHPFVREEKLYKTGDLGRWLPDGNIEFLGRIDHQVKIRGYRIELGEIESQLSKIHFVKECIAIDRERNGEIYLCAYIVPERHVKNTEPAVELRKVLATVLPEYMIPSYFVELDRIPLTPSGKIDRKCLPEPIIEAGDEYIAPRNKDERRLVQLWSEVLGIRREAISMDANFFELGGHSLKATILISKIHRAFNIRIPLGVMFVNPTIEELSKVIREKEGISDEYAKIEVSEKKEYYPLSPAQKRLYILQQMEVKNTSYNLPGIIELGEEVKLDRLEQAFRKIISRHESLRTSFDMVNSEPVQKISGEVEFKIEHYHLKSDGDDINSDNDHSFIARGVNSVMEKFVRFFDLSKAPLLRVGIINGEFSNSILVFDLHHIITDGISQNLLEQEFYSFYSGGELPLLRLQYKDFGEWHNNNIRQGLLKEQEEYWIRLFSDELPALHLPSDFSRPLVRSFEGAAVRFVLNPEETKEIKAVARENDATLFMVMLSIFTIFLSKLSGSSRGGDQEDIIVGTPIAGRRHADLENIIGMFVNSLPLRNSPAGDKSFKQFLDEVKQRTLEAFENQEYQFEDLVERVEVNRDTSRNPLFDVMFVFQNMDISGVEISGLTVNPYDYENRTSRFDLTLQGIERGENLFFILEYCTKLFKKETIDRLISYFRRALSIILTEPEIKIFEIDIVPEEEKQQMLFEFNDTNVDYPNDKTLHALFEEQAEKTPGNTAIIYKDNQLTYKELNKKAIQLANYLYYEKHVRFEYLIGIYMEEPIKQVIAMLGILKAGCAYVPIDAYIPHARVKDMIDDSKIEIVISQKRFINALSKLQCECQSFKSFLCLDSHNLYLEEKTGKNESNHGLDLDLKTENAAYLIYTSGSTGQPKGAIVEHKSVVNTLLCRGNEYKLKTNDTILQLFSYAFDGFVTSFFTPIISGAKVILQSRDGMKDISNIIVTLINNCVTHFISVPPLYQTIIEIISEYDKDCIKVVTLAGDKILPGVIEKTKEKRKNFEIAIEYGITEVSVMSTIFRNQQGSERIKIGKPIWNTKIYVVNKQNHSQPIGVAGELSIAGVGLARGYLNNKNLTNEKFIDSPFVKGEKLYRTGDLARWLPDGNIEFLGRLDDQVKIRGYRIELGEIENQLERHRYISKAVVLVKEERENQSLYAYIASNGEGEISKSDLREYLLRTLPDYMIPSHFVQLENIPLTPIGKIDKRALLYVDIKVGEEYTAPSNETEKKLVAIWSEVLGIKKDVISIDSNFFNLGGNSLKVTILAAKMHKEFDVKVALAEIFRFPTVRNLSKYLKVGLKEKYSVIQSIEKKEYYPLSSSQKRLFFLQQMDANSTGYNISEISILEGDINIEKFENIFKALINRHESFRTSFKLIEEIPRQMIRDDVHFKIEYKNPVKRIKNLEGDERKEEIIQKVYRDFIQPFSLGHAPLVRVKLVKIGIDKSVLMIDMHHIITDGISIGILLKEFIMLFDEKELQKIRIYFKDFTQWQNDILNSQEIEKQRDYWLKQFENDTPSLNLPMDYNRPSDKDYDGSSVVLELSEKLAISLKKLAFDEEVTMFMIFFAAYNIFLSKICDQDDIIVGVPVGGRKHADLESMVGMFVNTLAIRSFPGGEKTFIEFLKEVKKTTLDAFENQDYQFEDLVEKLAIPRNPGRNPLFDVSFLLQEYNLKFKTLHSKDTTITIKDYKLENTTSYFDLSLVCSLNEKKIYLFFEYRIKLFKKSTIERFIEYFNKILSYIVENEKIKLKDINISHDLIDIRTELFPDNDNDFGF